MLGFWLMATNSIPLFGYASLRGSNLTSISSPISVLCLCNPPRKLKPCLNNTIRLSINPLLFSLTLAEIMHPIKPCRARCLSTATGRIQQMADRIRGRF